MTAKEYLSKGRIKFDPTGGYIWLVESDGNHVLICEIRGWGHIQHLFDKEENAIEKAYKLQDEIGEFITDAIKEKLEKL